MPTTAPDVTLTATARKISFRYIDDSGDKSSHSVQVAPSVTTLQIQALATAIGAATNANLYKVVIEDEFSAVALRTPALQAPRSESVNDVIVMQYANAANQSERVYVPAPVEALFSEGTDSPSIVSPQLVAVMDAIAPILSTYSALGVRYTERSEINSQVKI